MQQNRPFLEHVPIASSSLHCGETLKTWEDTTIYKLLTTFYTLPTFNINGKDKNTELNYDIVGVIHVADAWMPLWKPK